MSPSEQHQVDCDDEEPLVSSSFIPEQEELFWRRFEENYDILDPVYLQWVKINHPDKYPDNTTLSDHFLCNYYR